MLRVTERTIPILPCRQLDDVAPFYAALGFEQTYRQERPNPYLCLNRGGIDLHFFGLADFDPANSLGNVGVLVPDTGALYDEFAAGLRAAYGKLPMAGIPRITRPRRKQGTSGGFTVVDPGGNWLRISSTGNTETETAPDRDTDGWSGARAGRLDRVTLNAARQGDAHGDEAAAIAVLEAGLARHPDATAVERVPVLVYLAELLHRSGQTERALATLAAVEALDLDEAGRTVVGTDLRTAAELRAEIS